MVSRDCQFYEPGVNGKQFISTNLVDNPSSRRSERAESISQGTNRTKTSNLDDEIEHSLARVFEEEVNGAKSLEEYREAVQEADGYDVHELFNVIDTENQGFLDIRDLYNFMNEHLGTTTYQRSERVLRRLDLNSDGKITLSEFEFGLTGVANSVNHSKINHKSPRYDKDRSYRAGRISNQQESIRKSPYGMSNTMQTTGGSIRRPSPSRYSKVPQRSPKSPFRKELTSTNSPHDYGYKDERVYEPPTINDS